MELVFLNQLKKSGNVIGYFYRNYIFLSFFKYFVLFQAIDLSWMTDAVSTKNKLIVIQDNALCEINPNYEVIKLQNSFSSLKNDCKMFTL